jgi:hypothetical protein
VRDSYYKLTKKLAIGVHEEFTDATLPIADSAVN